MSIISKYILKEHLGPFLFGLGTITFIFMLNIVFRDIGRLFGKGLPALVIIEFFIFNLAWVVALAVPMAVLISTLMAFGRLSGDNEIAMLKASGVNLYRLITPLLVIATLLALLMAKFNDSVLPHFNFKVRQLYSDISRKKPTIALEPHVFYEDIANYSILIHDLDEKTNRMENVIINDNSDKKFKRTIIAEYGDLNFSEEQEMMILTLFNGELHEVEKDNFQGYRRLQFKRQVFSIPVPNMTLKRSENQHRGDREKTAAMMWEDINRQKEVILQREVQIKQITEPFLAELYPQFYKQDSTVQNPVQYFSNSSLRPKYMVQRLESEIKILKQYQKAISRLRVEIEKKYSIPVACIVFVLVGAPLGVMARQGGIGVGGGMSLTFFLVYWTFLIGGEQLADRGLVNPIIAMWIPNVLVGAAGVYLVIHTVKEATFIPWQEWGYQITRVFKRIKT